jgi:agmatinase
MHEFILNNRVAALLAIALASPGAYAGDEHDMPGHVVGKDPYPFDTADPREEGPEPIELPESAAEKLSLLTDEEIAFLESGDARPFAGPLEATLEALEERTPDEVKEWVNAMQHVASHFRYQEGRDDPNIPFNTDSPEFNAWRAQRPRSMDPAREDGPIELGRYGGRGGPPTFGGHPLALSKEDLVAGEVDVAIVGAPLNMGSGWRDSGGRATTGLRLFGWPMGSNDQYVQVNAGKVLNIVDYGDIAIDNNSTERSMRHVREVVREIAEAGAIPVIIGGDHSLEYPNVAALADVYGKEQVSVIHFDSHYDAWWGGAHLISHGAPVYRLINEGHVRAADYIQVDPAFATATGTPVPGGLNMREAITIVRRLCAESNVVSFDLVEFHPALDPTYKSALNSAFIVKACLTGIAMNREGKTAEHYLSPVASEHAIDDYYGDRQQYLDATQAEEEEEERKKAERRERDR